MSVNTPKSLSPTQGPCVFLYERKWGFNIAFMWLDQPRRDKQFEYVCPRRLVTQKSFSELASYRFSIPNRRNHENGNLLKRLTVINSKIPLITSWTPHLDKAIVKIVEWSDIFPVVNKPRFGCDPQVRQG
jgi:hypothetical protein